MTDKQFRMANKTAFTIITIVMSYFFLTLIAYIAYYPPEKINWTSYTQLITAFIALCIVVYIYMLRKKTHWFVLIRCY